MYSTNNNGAENCGKHPHEGLVTRNTAQKAGMREIHTCDTTFVPFLLVGKAEHMSIVVPTASLHVHERIHRRRRSKADLVDCMVALPGQLFYSTQIPVSLWFLAKNKNADAKRGFRDRRGLENQLALAAGTSKNYPF